MLGMRAAAFDDPVAAIAASVELQLALAAPPTEGELALRVRCGLHVGAVEQRDGDFFGNPVNRAARIMSVAHGGQVLLSQAVVDLVSGRLPPGVEVRDLGAVRLRDLTRPEHVFQILHPQLRQDFPALRSLESTPNNLPQQVTSFAGASRARGVKRLLGTTRLLTLLGVGGIGKTRSRCMWRRSDGRLPDGVGSSISRRNRMRAWFRKRWRPCSA